MATIEEAIETVHAAGFTINNLFELETGWRANITDGELYFEFGNGDSPAAALLDALNGKGIGEKASVRKPVSTSALDDLIAGGL